MVIKRVYPRFLFSRPEYDRLRVQYTKESGVKLWGGSKTDPRDYDDTKMIVALEGEVLVGFSCIRLIKHPHYVNATIASMDAIYLEPSSRKGGAGLKLLNEARAYAHDCGAESLIMSAPYGSRLAKMLRVLFRDDPVQEVFCIGTDIRKGKRK